MTLVAAIFHDSSDLENALDSLNEAGFGDDVSFVVDTPSDASAAGSDQVAAPLGVTQTEGWTAPTAPIGGAWSGRLDALGEAAQFFRASVRDGADLVVIETETPERITELLDGFASRIERA